MPVRQWLNRERMLSPRARRVLWTVLHGLALVAAVVALWYVSRRYRLDRYLDSNYPIIHPYWLPVLFLLLYLLVRVGLWLYWALGPDRPTGEFPDLDATWAAAVAELERSNIDLKAVPLYLVFGRPMAGVEAFFAAARVPLLVRSSPPGPGMPLRVHAHPGAVFVTCDGTSLFGRQIDLMCASAPPSSEDAPPGPLPARGHLLTDPDALSQSSARLRYLCRLIARARAPYCGVNGFVWFVPATALKTVDGAEEAGLVCQRDLTTAREALQVCCPSLFAVADLDKFEGVNAYLNRLSAGQRGEPLGASFPVVPNTDPSGTQRMMREGVAWLCRAAFPASVESMIRLERPGEMDRWAAWADNVPLVLAVKEVAELEQPLSRFLVQATNAPLSEPALVGGCFLVATGDDSNRAAFASAVLDRMSELQNAVAWTEDARAEEQFCGRLVVLGAGILLIWLAALLLGLIRSL